MATTIQVSRYLLERLAERKFYGKESYEEVIWDLLEDASEISEETKKAIKESEEDVRAGRVKSWEQIKRELKLHV